MKHQGPAEEGPRRERRGVGRGLGEWLRCKPIWQGTRVGAWRTGLLGNGRPRSVSWKGNRSMRLSRSLGLDRVASLSPLLSLSRPTIIPATVPTMTNSTRQDQQDTEQRPQKRYRAFRDVEDNLRPYTIPVSGPSGLHSEADGGAEGGAKKARKRPLSCGECRRCVNPFPRGFFSPPTLIPALSLKLKVHSLGRLPRT